MYGNYNQGDYSQYGYGTTANAGYGYGTDATAYQANYDSSGYGTVANSAGYAAGYGTTATAGYAQWNNMGYDTGSGASYPASTPSAAYEQPPPPPDPPQTAQPQTNQYGAVGSGSPRAKSKIKTVTSTGFNAYGTYTGVKKNRWDGEFSHCQLPNKPK